MTLTKNELNPSVDKLISQGPETLGCLVLKCHTQKPYSQGPKEKMWKGNECL